MSGKTRSFSVTAFVPVAPPIGIVAHSKNQLARRLADALEVVPDRLNDVADALWKGRPVFMTDLGLAILPGRYSAISYQMLDGVEPAI
jgi:hypothetical protein